MTSQTTTQRGPLHHVSCPCTHCYGTQTYDLRSRCMGCKQPIPHGNVQLTAIGVMDHECAYLLGWVATLEGTDPSADARAEWDHAAVVAA